MRKKGFAFGGKRQGKVFFQIPYRCYTLRAYAVAKYKIGNKEVTWYGTVYG